MKKFKPGLFTTDADKAILERLRYDERGVFNRERLHAVERDGKHIGGIVLDRHNIFKPIFPNGLSAGVPERTLAAAALGLHRAVRES